MYTFIEFIIELSFVTYTCESAFFVISISLSKLSDCKCGETLGEGGVGSSQVVNVY